jgi:fatty-acyl-CoA synthase
MGMGAVCHTLTTPDLLSTTSVVVQSEARVLIVSADLLPLARLIAEGAPSIDGGGDRAGRVRLRPAPVVAVRSSRCSRRRSARRPGATSTKRHGSYLGHHSAPKGVTCAIAPVFHADAGGFHGHSADSVLAVVPMLCNAWAVRSRRRPAPKLVLPDGGSTAAASRR